MKSFEETVRSFMTIKALGTDCVPRIEALELAREADKALAAARSPIIFDPTDSRVEVGREYEFSDTYKFSHPRRATLRVLTDAEDTPFASSEFGHYAFIREVTS